MYFCLSCGVAFKTIFQYIFYRSCLYALVCVLYAWAIYYMHVYSRLYMSAQYTFQQNRNVTFQNALEVYAALLPVYVTKTMKKEEENKNGKIVTVLYTPSRSDSDTTCYQHNIYHVFALFHSFYTFFSFSFSLSLVFSVLCWTVSVIFCLFSFFLSRSSYWAINLISDFVIFVIAAACLINSKYAEDVKWIRFIVLSPFFFKSF